MDELFRRAPHARTFLVCAVVLGVLGAAATVAQMVFLSEVVGAAFVNGAGLDRVTEPLLLFLAAALLRAGLLWAREVVDGRGAVRVKSEIRDRLFAHLMRLGPAYAEGERAGELATTATEGVEKLEPYFARYLPQKVLSGLVPLLVALYVLPKDPSSAVLLLVTAPVIPVMMILVGSYAEEHMKSQWTALSRLGARFLDAMQGLPTLKAFNRGPDESERVAAASEEFRERTMKVLRYAFLSGLVLEFTTAIAISLVAVTLGVRLVSGSIPFEEAFLVLLLAPEFYKPLRELGIHRHAGMEGKAAAERIAEVLNTPAPVASEREERRELGRLPGGPEIEFSGVSYAYPGREQAALSGLTLTLPAGSRTALVGRSGSGKSTLVDLLVRFMDPDDGVILANGVGISGLPAEAWRENVALVPQRPHLFHGTVMENLLLARPGASREEVERAAELAGADAFIRRLPEGYETRLGERGARLSGGEAQRLAIARAFLKDAPVLVMDEPTSALDPESEEEIRRAIRRLSEGRTTLIVAHRMGTIRGADRIAVLEDGGLAETGTHEELILRGGPYARLANAYGEVPAWGLS